MKMTELPVAELDKHIAYCSDIVLGLRKANTTLFTKEKALDALYDLKQERQRRKQTELDFK